MLHFSTKPKLTFIRSLAVVLGLLCTGSREAKATIPAVLDSNLLVIPTTPGTYTLPFLHASGRREYILQIPANYDPANALPLLIGFHAGDATAKYFAENNGYLEETKAAGILAVFPQGLGAPNSQQGSWNSVHCCGYTHAVGTDDEGFIVSLQATLKKKLNIDTLRVYLAGYSNGAMFAHLMAAKYSHLFAAMGSYAGTIGGRENVAEPEKIIPTPMNPIAIMMIHGKLDTAVPFANDTTGRIDIPVARSIDFWVKANRCDAKPDTLVGNSGNVRKFTYKNGLQNTEAVLITIENADHSYPTVRANGIDATKEIVAFVLKFKKKPVSTAVAANHAGPAGFRLFHNYPNPFNPSTVIRFQLPVSSSVTLKVFDVNGRAVATLVDGEMTAGNHTVTFAPQDLAGGIYFYQLSAGKFSQARKAILMK